MAVTLEQPTDPGRSTRASTIPVWDPLVRLFHWLLVAAFIVAWATGEDLLSVHEAAGYTILGLIVLRVVWGLVGSRHARFSDFLYRPATTIGFIKDSLAFRGRRYIGHNPAGGVMVVLMLLSLTAIVGTGYMMTTDAYRGLRWLREVHSTAVDLTIVLVIVHLVGVAVASFEHHENLVKAMFTGRKRTPETD